jgi:hypothetical protein
MATTISNITNLPDEIWKSPPGYSRYEVSNLGRIRSLTDNSGKVKPSPTHMINPTLSKVGYPKISLMRDDGFRKCGLVHQFVALAFIGPREIGMQVCHNDGDKTNNNLSNLRYDTQENNMLDAINQGTIRRGIKVNTNKLDEEEVIVIKKLYHIRGIGITLLSKIFGVSKENIKQIVFGKSWKHIIEYSYPDHRISSYDREAQ